jgi:hypothetical protein
MKETPAVGPGQGEQQESKCNGSPHTALGSKRQQIDPRLAFLACAGARLDLVEAGAITLDEALDDEFIERFRSVAEITCRCEREILDAFDRVHRQLSEQRLLDWRWSRRP